MLAEPRFKTRYILNPKKNAWSSDESSYGRKMMERMGWSDGKGLGRTEQGLTEAIRVTYKNDSKGMGFKGNPDGSVQQQDAFSELLAELNQDHQAVQTASALSSLEKKSESSKARVHYKKFTRGKDLSLYSKQDLACIVGLDVEGLAKKKKQESQRKVASAEQEVEGNHEPSTFGIPTTNGGLIGDYFKQKMKKWAKPGQAEERTAQDILSEAIAPENEVTLKTSKSKRKHKQEDKHKDFEAPNSKEETLTYDVKLGKRKSKKVRKSEAKIKQERNATDSFPEDRSVPGEETEFSSEKKLKKKLKKKKIYDGDSVEQGSLCLNEIPNQALDEEKTKKKRNKDNNKELEHHHDFVPCEELPKKKKRKSEA